MSQHVNILAFAASTRKESLNKKLVQAAATFAGDATTSITLIDLKNFPIPLYDGDYEEENGQPDSALQLRALFKQHDALIIASPEYNGFFPPLLKNTFDWLSRPLDKEERHAAFKSKSVLLMSATRGESGGKRGLNSLRQLLNNLKAEVHEREFLMPKGNEAFDVEGNIISQPLRNGLLDTVHGFVKRLHREADTDSRIAANV
jgi:NAD(P)H-dependent FMN reductase